MGALRHVVRFLSSTGTVPLHELYLSRNKFTVEGLKWLLGCVAVHPAYPVWRSDTERYLPLWIRIDDNLIDTGNVHAALQTICSSICCSVCCGEQSGDAKCSMRQCVNIGCCDDMKHNCIAHICHWGQPADGTLLPEPGPHALQVFTSPGRGVAARPPSGAEEPMRAEPRIIYEDDDIAVVLKPQGWSCMPNPPDVNPAWGRMKPLAKRQQVAELLTQSAPAPLQGWLLLRFGADPNCEASRDQASDRGMTHRLDVDTSGPLLVGKTLRGCEHSRKQIVAGILKDYVVLVHGTLSTSRGECNAPINTKVYSELKHVTIDANGQPATTVWEVLVEYQSPDKQETYTLMHCRMATLRTHQIRIHMQHLGHPIVGDPIYGSEDKPVFCPRIFLHKFRIGFFNVQGEACIETCSLQTMPDLWKALGRLSKVGGMAMTGCGAPGL